MIDKDIEIDAEEQFEEKQFTAPEAFDVSDGGHVPRGTTITGYLRRDNEEPNVSRSGILDYFQRKGSYPVVQFDDRKYVLLPADVFGKSDNYIVFAKHFDKPEGDE